MFCHFSVEAVKFPNLDIYPWFWNHPQEHVTWSLFSSHFCYISFNFSFKHALLCIFGNAHWILKTALQTSSPTVSTIPLCFYDFSLFYRVFFFFFFSFSIAMLSILEMCPVPWKRCPTSSPTMIFPLFIVIFHLA